ncbi:MAG: Tic22 family protein [Geitlerinemataceae cyanobacterium]
MKRLTRILAPIGAIAGAAIVSTTGIARAQDAPDPSTASIPATICNSREDETTSRFCPKLLPIPVFTVTNADGSPIVTSVELSDGSTQEIGGVFLNPNDAQAFVSNLQENQPELSDRVQVSVLTLAEIYEADRANHIAHEDPMEFAYVPSREQLQQVRDIFAERNINVEGFDGVPLFFATSRADGGYLTIEQEGGAGGEFIPMYFDRASLDGLLALSGDEALRGSIQYDVLSLERMLKTMQVLDALEQLDAIVADPSSADLAATRIPDLPEMMVPEVLAILSQGEDDPLAAAIAARLQDDSFEGESAIDRIEAFLDAEIQSLVESGTPSPIWQEIRSQLDLGLGQILDRIAFFPSQTSVQFIQELLQAP